MTHILVVDDNDNVRRSLCELLEGEGYAVTTAADGAVALAQLLESAAPTVVLTDLEMPRCNGVEFLRAVAADTAVAARHRYLLMTSTPERHLSLPDDVRAMLAVPPLEKLFGVSALLAAVEVAAAALAAA